MSKILFLMVFFCFYSASLIACSKKFFLSDFHLNLDNDGNIDSKQVPNYELFKKNIEFIAEEIKSLEEPCLVINGDPFNRDAIEPRGKPIPMGACDDEAVTDKTKSDCLERIYGTISKQPSELEAQIKTASFKNLVDKIYELSGKHKNIHIYSNFGDHETPKVGTGKKSIPSRGLLMMPLLEKYGELGGKSFGCPLKIGDKYSAVADSTRIIYPFCNFKVEGSRCVIDKETPVNKDTACLQIKKYFKFLEKRGQFGKKTADDIFNEFKINRLALDADLVLRRRTPADHDPCPDVPFGTYNSCLESRFSMEIFQTEKYKKTICEGWHKGGNEKGPKIHVMKGDSTGSWIDRAEDCDKIQNSDPEAGHLAIFPDGERLILRHTEAGFPGSKVEAMLYESQLEKANQYEIWGEDRRYRFNQGDYWTKDDAAIPANSQLLQVTSDTHFSRKSLGTSTFPHENEFLLNIGGGHRGINTGTMSEFSLRNRNSPNTFYASANENGEHYASDMTPVILHSLNNNSFVNKTECANLQGQQRDGCLIGSLIDGIYKRTNGNDKDVFGKNLRAFLSIVESTLPEKKDNFRDDFYNNSDVYFNPIKSGSVFCEKIQKNKELIHFMDFDTLYTCINNDDIKAKLAKTKEAVYQHAITNIKNNWSDLNRDTKAGLSSVLLSYANNYGPQTSKNFTEQNCGKENESLDCYLMIPKDLEKDPLPAGHKSYVDLSKMEIFRGYNPNNIFNKRMLQSLRTEHCRGGDRTLRHLINLGILQPNDLTSHYQLIKEKTRNTNFILQKKTDSK